VRRSWNLPLLEQTKQAEGPLCVCTFEEHYHNHRQGFLEAAMAVVVAV
jgi:hypothetical protein